MLAYTYRKQGEFALQNKPEPVLTHAGDAVVRVTMSSICTSDLHIKHGSVPRAVPGITVGHEMVGVVEQVGSAVKTVKPGDRVAVNVETFCGHCFFCQHGFVNNCTDPNGGWALGCRIDGGQAEYVRVPYADQGLTVIPDRFPTGRRCLPAMYSPPATGQPGFPRSGRATPCLSSVPDPPASAPCCAPCCITRTGSSSVTPIRRGCALCASTIRMC